MNLLLILLCLSAGALLRRRGAVSEDAHRGINAWLMHVALPAAALKYIPTVEWDARMLLPALSPVIVWCGAWLFFARHRSRRSDPATQGALRLAGGLGNTSFVGFPLITALYGPEALRIAIVCDQVTFILLSTVGTGTAMAAGSATSTQRSALLLRLLRFPPFIAFVAAILLPFVTDLSAWTPLLDPLAATLVPLALFSIGLQLRTTGWREALGDITQALSYKLLLAPALVLVVALLTGVDGIIGRISVFEAGMATMATAAIVAAEYGANERLVGLLIGVGIPLSLLTAHGWWWLLERVL